MDTLKMEIEKVKKRIEINKIKISADKNLLEGYYKILNEEHKKYITNEDIEILINDKFIITKLMSDKLTNGQIKKNLPDNITISKFSRYLKNTKNLNSYRKNKERGFLGIKLKD